MHHGRCVHVGIVSGGCMTVLHVNQWAAIHAAIIGHRDPTGTSVARRLLRGKPERAE